MQSNISDAEAQANVPEPVDEDPQLKLKAYERVKLYPKVPIEPSAYGKGKSYSRPWILQDGRPVPDKGSEMRRSYQIPKKSSHTEGIRKRMLTDFFWEQMLDEVLDELATSQPVVEYCTEHNANYVRENFTPRDLEVTADKNIHLKYPLYGTGSSAITYYSETIKKTGPFTNRRLCTALEAIQGCAKVVENSSRIEINNRIPFRRQRKCNFFVACIK